jgi:ATP-binding cassette, subfamily B, bacterial
MSVKPSKTATKLAVRHYTQEIWRQKKFSIPTFLLVSVGSVFSGYVPPLIIAAMINRFGNNPPGLEEVTPYLLLFAGAWLFGELLWRLCFVFLNRTDARGMEHLYTAGLNYLKQKDIKFFHDNFAGALTKKVIGYGRSFESFMDTLAFNIAKNILPLVFVSVVLWQFSPWIVAALLVFIALVLLLLIPLIKRRKKLVDAREAAANHMAGHVADVIGNMDAVQAFAHEEEEQTRHHQNVKDYISKAQRSWDYHVLRIDSVISPIYVLINTLGLALAVLLSPSGTATAAIFVTFSYFSSITMMLWEFNRTYRNLENAIAEASQFTELLLAPSAVQDPAKPKPFAVSKGRVEFKQVHFAYNDDSHKLFAGLNLAIQPGEKIALVGHSGGGKTTITKLLLRFVDVSSGELLIDGQNIAHAKLKDVRSTIAYVPQEPAMFHRTIRENIRYGRLKASDKEVIAAAKKANAHEFISQLPKGYDTLVGERGVKLSGGQRQRVAIARAIIKDAPILVLDEATSALDSESEKLIQAALRELMKNRTAIVIAHRLSTIQKMDRIVVLENGHIAEQGSHTELLKRGGIYASLWAHQSGGFMEET